MLYKIRSIMIVAGIIVGLSHSSCKKFLEGKSDQKLTTPETLEDLQLILDSYTINNVATNAVTSCADEYYLFNTTFNATNTPAYLKDTYIWSPDLDNSNDWNIQYRGLLYANTVLDNLENISPQGNEGKWNYIKGQALLFRAHFFYQIAQLFAPPYDPTTASSDLGIPLRLNSDFNEPSTRSTVQQTYDRITSDLVEAFPLLPSTIDKREHKTRPSRPAAFGLLARVYLTMGDFPKAKVYADSCLSLYNTLLNYNNSMPPDSVNLTPSLTSAFQIFNLEVIFYINTTGVQPLLTGAAGKVDTNLVFSYASNDRRIAAFYRYNSTERTYRYKGSYNGANTLFNGIAVDEIYLIRAECYARLGNTSAAMNDLNTLLNKRFPSPPNLGAATPEEALSKVLAERRKELVGRGTRWTDLRRLNKLGANITIQRVVNGQTYTLLPNDLRYTLLIPPTVINMTGMPQNPR